MTAKRDDAVGKPAALVPYVSATDSPAEFTLRAVVLGTVLSVVFGMVNAYVGLKAGITVSASIPAAVLSMAVFRTFARRGSILENNVVHTIASAGESLAAGVIFTVPALIFIGIDPSGFRIFLIGATAGLLGILMMIPLRQYLTVTEHGKLPYPEGTACAEVLIAGDRGGAAARPVFVGIGLGALLQFLTNGTKLWVENAFVSIASLHKMSFGTQVTPLYLGVGYLIGLRVAAIMAGGGILAWALLIPLFDILSGTAAGNALGLGPDLATKTAREIWKGYVRYVGAGAVACGGALSILRALPLIADSFRKALAQFGATEQAKAIPRTERDLPPAVVFGGTAVLTLVLWLAPPLEMGLLQTLLAVGFTYFFVVVSARMVGLVGNTSQPISGMTITALLATAFVLHACGYEGQEGMAASLSVAIIVCVAVALAGDLSQDLKCGALLGATPRALQIGEMIGTLSAAVRAGWVLLLLHEAYQLGSEALPAPQAKLMETLVRGVMHGELPWGLLGFGAALALAAEAVGIASLPFAIGLYLPVSTTTPFLLGGMVAHWRSQRGEDNETPTLFASGLIAGESLIGIVLAGIVVRGWDSDIALRAPADGAPIESLIALAPLVLILVVLARYGAAKRA